MFDGIWSNIFRSRPKEDDEEDLIEVLKSTPIFSELSDREVRRIASIAYQRTFDEGEVIFREGQTAAGMYIIRRGEVRILKRTPEGEEVVLGELGRGDFFGEIGLLYKVPRTASAVAKTRCQLIGFFRPELLDLMDRDPRLAAKLLFHLGRVLAQRLVQTNEQYERALRRLREVEG